MTKKAKMTFTGYNCHVLKMWLSCKLTQLRTHN